MDFSLLFTERIKHCCKVFCGIIVIETNVFVAHGRNISWFIFKNRKFKLLRDNIDAKHTIQFSSDVKHIFKRLYTNPVTK